MNICEHLAATARLLPDRDALVFEGTSYTYRRLNELSAGAAAQLAAAGIRRGDRVALRLPNVPAFAVWYFGALRLGAVAVSLSSRAAPREAREMLADCEASALIDDVGGHDSLGTDLPACVQTVVTVADDGVPLDGDLSAACSTDWVDAEPHDVAVILYTSGTTGANKGAMLSHANVRSNVLAFNHLCGMRPGERILLAVPLFHCFGQNALLNASLHAGATLVMMRQFEPAAARTLIAEEKVTQLYGVPAMFRLLGESCRAADLASVTYCFSAAAPLAVEVSRRWLEKFGMPINEGYGLTETSPFACYNHRLRYELGSIGSPLDEVEMKVVDLETGGDCQPGDLGEIAIRGPNVMQGYWNRPAETAAAIRDGWFYSGDIGRRDERGYFYLVDRVKDMISVGGLKVYPAEVERVLKEHAGVADAAVVGVPEHLLGEQVVAFVVPRSQSDLAASASLVEALNRQCHEQLADYKQPTRIVVLDELPRNAAGKTLKRELRDRMAPPGTTRAATKADSPSTPSDADRPIDASRAEPTLAPQLAAAFSSDRVPIAAQFVIERVAALAPEAAPPSPESSFLEAGLDSVRIVELASRLEQELPRGEELPATALFDHPRIADLAAFLVTRLAPSETSTAASLSSGDGGRQRESEAGCATSSLREAIAAMSDEEALQALRRELEDA